MATRSNILTLLLAATTALASARHGTTTRAITGEDSQPKGSAKKAANADTPSVNRERSGTDLVAEYLAAGKPTDASRCDGTIAIAHSIIVILPDPLDSHLDWAFDSGLESVRRAMENNRYVLDRYWLPWTLDADTVHRASDHLGNSLRTKAPGVLLFRSSQSPRDSIAIVYLIGETPTRGIHATAFRAAMADRDSVLGCHPAKTDTPLRDTLRIVGPVFSGSARSLRDALDEWHRAHKDDRVLIISGGATAASNKWVLSGCVGEGSLRDTTAACASPEIQFFATVNTVNALKSFIESLLRDSLGVEPGQIAYLNESGTQFGQSLRASSSIELDTSKTLSRTVTPPDTLPLQLPFPMNISRLRKEYARRSSAADTLPGSSRTRLEWKDPASASETPSPLSELTAPIMERTIADIEQTLRMHRIRAVGILATDVRDRLFLASIIRERLRDIKIFLIGSHSLYLRPEVNEQLRGTFVVSTYPLFLESQFWDLTNNGDRQRLVFTSDISEGTYNAMLEQLGSGERMLDYGFPFQTQGVFVPPIWVTVIGSTAYLPLIAQRSAPQHRERGYVVWRMPQSTRPIAEGRGSFWDWDSPLISMTLLLGLFLLVIRLIMGTMGTLQDIRTNMESARERAERPMRIARKLASDASIHQESAMAWSTHSAELLHHRQSWTIFRFAAIICAVTPLVLILARAQIHGGAKSQLAMVALLLLLAATMAGAIFSWVLGRKLPEGADSSEGDVAGEATESSTHSSPTVKSPLSSRSQHYSMLLLATGYLALTSWFIFDVVTLDRARAAMFFMRALHLSSGVTPIVPLIVGGLVLVTWSSWHLKRVELLEDMSAFEAACWDGRIEAATTSQPDQPTPRNPMDLARLPGTRENFRTCVRVIRTGLLRLLPTNEARFLLAALVLLSFWIIAQFQRSMETAVLGGLFAAGLPGAFDFLLRFLILASLALSVWGLYRLVTVSRSLRHCLLNVEAMPLGAAFSRLPPAVAELTKFTPFGAASRATFHLTVDRTAHALWLELKAAHYPPASGAPQREALRFAGVRSANGEFDQAVAEPLIVMHEHLCAEVLDKASKAFQTLILHAPNEKDAKTSPRGAFFIMQELVALYVVDYVEWVVRHLRHLALNLLVCLALATVLLSSYPFEPETLVKVFLFTLMGTTVAVIMTTLVQMNRNPTLSRITHSTAGEVTWDRRFVVNLILVGGLPLITTVGTQFPQARELLFFWITPLLRALGKS